MVEEIDITKTVNELHAERLNIGDRIADFISTWIMGSWLGIAIHTVWFVVWFAFGLSVDVLTNVVSLEAIFMCIFLLMSGTRQATKDHIAAEHDYATNEAAKLEIEALVKMVIEQHDKQNSRFSAIEETLDLIVNRLPRRKAS